jgi:hypothetical protein
MNIQLAKIYGILIGALGIVGLFVSGHLFGIMNVDLTLDILRIVLAAYLLYAGFVSKSDRAVNGGLLVVGALYVVMGVVGLADSTLGGMLPAGLTGFDIVFHLLTGALAIYGGMYKRVTPAHA